MVRDIRLAMKHPRAESWYGTLSSRLKLTRGATVRFAPGRWGPVSNMGDFEYINLKHTLAASALVQAQSLPRELVRSRAGVNIPAPFPVREESKSDEIEVNANFDGDDFGYCECWPDLQVPLLQTASAVPGFSDAPIVVHAVHQTSTALAESAYGIAPTHTTVTRDYGGNIGNAIRFSHTAGAAPALTARLSIQQQPYAYPIALAVDLYAAGVWHLGWFFFGGHLQGADAMGWEDAAQQFAVPAATTHIRTRMHLPAATFLNKRRIVADIAFGRGAGPNTDTMRFSNGALAWDVCTHESWPYLPQLPDVDRIRNLGYEALLTYTGSRQLDGGKIAGALVPFDWSPTFGNPFDAVASVRHNKYSAALRSGAHGTWRIGAMEELDPRAPEARTFPAMKLVFGYQRNNAENQSLRIRATGLFGVYSDSPIIGMAPFVPPLTPADLDLLMEYFQTAPAVTENSLHEKIKSAGTFLTRAFKGVAGVAERGIGLVADHPDVASAIAMAAGQPEIAAGLQEFSAMRKKAKSKAAPQAPAKSAASGRVPANPKAPPGGRKKGARKQR